MRIAVSVCNLIPREEEPDILGYYSSEKTQVFWLYKILLKTGSYWACSVSRSAIMKFECNLGLAIWLWKELDMCVEHESNTTYKTPLQKTTTTTKQQLINNCDSPLNIPVHIFTKHLQMSFISESIIIIVPRKERKSSQLWIGFLFAQRKHAICLGIDSLVMHKAGFHLGISSWGGSSRITWPYDHGEGKVDFITTIQYFFWGGGGGGGGGGGVELFGGGGRGASPALPPPPSPPRWNPVKVRISTKRREQPAIIMFLFSSKECSIHDVWWKSNLSPPGST